MVPTILSVAGSDPCGGAGIQADIKTITTLGCYGAAAVTAITVQNSHGVQQMEPLSPDLVAAQIQAVLDDYRVSHVKIGMVGSVAIAEIIAQTLYNFDGEIVYDPVLHATTGQSLIGGNSRPDALNALLQKVTVLTPNIPELEQMTGQSIIDESSLLSCGQDLLKKNSRMKAVVIKGGHGIDAATVTDFLVCKDQFATTKTHKSTHKRIATQNSHGTGCTFASAFAAFHSQCQDYVQAFEKTSAYMHKLLEISSSQDMILNSHGTGPLFHALCVSAKDNE